MIVLTRLVTRDRRFIHLDIACLCTARGEALWPCPDYIHWARPRSHLFEHLFGKKTPPGTTRLVLAYGWSPPSLNDFLRTSFCVLPTSHLDGCWTGSENYKWRVSRQLFQIHPFEHPVLQVTVRALFNVINIFSSENWVSNCRLP